MGHNTNERRNKLALLLAMSFFGISSLAFAQDSMNGHGMSGMPMQGPMMKAMEHSDNQMKSMRESGNIDRDFAMMMRAHHQGSIAMAQAELESGKDPEMRRVAQKIINSQKKEIAQFDKWLSKQSGATPSSEAETPYEDKSRHLHPRDAK